MYDGGKEKDIKWSTSDLTGAITMVIALG